MIPANTWDVDWSAENGIVPCCVVHEPFRSRPVVPRRQRDLGVSLGDAVAVAE